MQILTGLINLDLKKKYEKEKKKAFFFWFGSFLMTVWHMLSWAIIDVEVSPTHLPFSFSYQAWV